MLPLPVIGDQEAFPRRVHGQVTGSRAAGRLLVQQGELAGFRVQAEGADGADGLAAQAGGFACRIEEAPARDGAPGNSGSALPPPTREE